MFMYRVKIINHPGVEEKGGRGEARFVMAGKVGYSGVCVWRDMIGILEVLAGDEDGDGMRWGDIWMYVCM